MGTAAFVPTAKGAALQPLMQVGSSGRKTVYFGRLTMSSSYATGGEAIALKGIFRKGIDHIFFSSGLGGYRFEWDVTNKKVKAYVSTGTEVTATTDLATGAGAISVMIVGE